jgi:hypothetical protein
MSDESERQAWWKKELTITNVVMLILFIGSLVSWQRGTEAKNDAQDSEIRALTDRVDRSDNTYMRSDIAREKLDRITEKLDDLGKKVDNISKAVR